MIGIGLVNAQISKVTGNVTSEEDGLPVVGASVLVKGTTVGTVTDIDGNFTLTNVPSSAGTLVISFIGMQSQEVKIKPNVNVVLKSDAEALDEVVVVGYGSAKKVGTVVGSIANVTSEKKIITPCNINRQRILMIPCFIFYRNPEYACKHISHSPFNSIYFILT